MKLFYAIVYTSDMERMTRFYQEGLGLEPESAAPFFAEFRTGASSLCLLAIHPGEPAEFELCFAVDSIEREIEVLRSRGMEFIDDLRQQPFGKLIHARDAEGTVVTLLEPVRPNAAKGEPALATIILNTWDFGAAQNFYRDRLGLPVLHETPHWIEFDTGGARLAVHARAERPDLPPHARQKAACTFEVDDLEAFVRVLDEFGTPLATPPTEAEFGTYAEVLDPDGNRVVFREPPTAIPAPEVAAAAFEDDGVPPQTGMRRPVKKRSKAVSRVAIKPEYKASRKEAERKSTAAAKANGGGKLRVVAERGVGPERSRQEPKVTSRDPKRAKAKPATGRLKKAEARNVERKKKAVAGASKSKPVKRAAAKSARRATAGARGRR